MRTASCSCEQLKVRCAGEPIRISMCHCLACQKRTGSAFAIQARWPSDRVTIEGRAQEYVRAGDEGSSATFRFCPVCGATVYWDNDTMPGMLAVPVGAFADPSFPPPQVSVYGVRRHPWAIMPALTIEDLE
ncbi:MAG: GFA family protein [Kofleriaceae bacterium]